MSKSSGSHKDGLGLHYVACEESLKGNVPQSRIGGWGEIWPFTAKETDTKKAEPGSSLWCAVWNERAWA